MFTLIGAAVTPFTSAGDIDVESTRRLHTWSLANGLDGLFIIGSMGEWQVLTADMRDVLVGTASEVVAGTDKLLIVGVHDVSLPRIRENMDKLSHHGHTHWTAMLPGGAALGDPVEAAHNLADHADRPFVLYNLPQVNGVVLSVPQYREILAHPNIVAVKNSAGQMRTRKDLLMQRRDLDFALYEGDEWAVDEALILGLDGLICGFGTMGARIFRAIADAVVARDYEAAKTLQIELIDIMYRVYGASITHWARGQKYGLQQMGLIDSDKCLYGSQQHLPAGDAETIRRCIADYPRWFQV